MNDLTKKVLLLLKMWDDPQASEKDIERELKVSAFKKPLEQIMDELIIANLQSQINLQSTISLTTSVLRDDFAAKALTGILASQTKFRGNFAYNGKDDAKDIAEECYLLADALIKERLKKS